MDILEKVTKSQIRKDIPEFRTGYTIRVSVKIKEGKRERIQDFEGIVVSIQGRGIGKTFTVRKISGGIGVERIFPFNSPKIEKITVVRKGKVRQSKIYYVRDKIGTVKIKESK